METQIKEMIRQQMIEEMNKMNPEEYDTIVDLFDHISYIVSENVKSYIDDLVLEVETELIKVGLLYTKRYFFYRDRDNTELKKAKGWDNE